MKDTFSDPASPPVPLPARVFRNEMVHRSLGPFAPVGAGGCGFMLKSGAAQDYVQRRLPDYVAVCVLRGRGRHVDHQGRSWPVGPGAVVQLPPGLPHTMHHQSSDWAEFWFSLSAGFWEPLRVAGLLETRPVLWPGLSLAWAAQFERLVRLLREAADDRAGDALLLVQRLLLEMHEADRAHTRPAVHAPVVIRACRLMAEAGGHQAARPAAGREPDLRRLAEEEGMSYERFRKVFREQTGMPPGEYRIRLRIDRARDALLSSDWSVKEIAYALDYSNPFVFSRQFKQYVGLSPQAYRASV